MSQTQKNSKREWVISAIVFLFILGIKIFISYGMKSAYIFSDEQSYFGMMDKIAQFKFDTIRNSHMPGYPLLASPLYAISSTSLQAYRGVLIFNCIVGTLSYPLVFYLCKYVFEMKGSHSILVGAITSLASGLFAYNYVILSETVQTIFYLGFFVLFCDVLCQKGNSSKWKWVLMGVILGFLPIIKTQARIIFILYFVFTIMYQLTKGNIIEKKGLLISSGVAVCVFLFFRMVIFTNVGLYEGQVEENLGSLLTVFDDKEHFSAFFHISCAELAYFIVATGVIPFFAIIVFIIDSIKDIFKDKEKILIALFVLLVIGGNVLITIIHAYTVSIEYNNVTMYARYIDFIQPILIALGLGLAIKNKEWKLKKIYLIVAALMAILVFLVYPSINKFEVNSYSVRLFENIPTMVYIIVFCAAFIICGVTFGHKKCGLIISLCLLTVLYMAMDCSAVSIQLAGGSQIAQVYKAAYYFAENPIYEENIFLDSDFFGAPLPEDYMPGTGEIKGEASPMAATFKYMVLFWGIKNNVVSLKEISKDDAGYIYSDKLLTRDILAVEGTILYDKENCNDYTAKSDILFRTSENVEIVNEDFLKITGDEVKTNLFIDNVKEFEVTFNYAGNVEVLPEDDMIACCVNGYPLERVLEDDVTHRIIFRWNGDKPITIDSLVMKYSGKYIDLLNEDILYWGSMDISYQ